MSWLKGSDKAATFPKALNVPHFSKGEIGVNEMFGFIHRCAYESAAHRTDYVIEFGVAMMMGEGKHAQLLAVAEQAGLLEQLETDGAPSWKIVEDPDFIHLITKAEQEWMNQQKRDSRDTKLTSAVRLRDGDACRYCLKIVYFGADRKSARAGSYTRAGSFDHVISGEAATIETLVVACGECNSKKKDNDDALDLQPPPSEPFYSPSTAAWLAKHGHPVQPTTKHPALKKKATTADGTPSAPRPVEPPTQAAPGSTQATEAPSGQASSTDDTPGNGSATTDQPDPAGHQPDGSRHVGSGLGTGHGSGSGGKASQPATTPSPPAKTKTRRRRPRTRGRN
jgi:5-methylcytosine-specific restriction endonuclease McrA